MESFSPPSGDSAGPLAREEVEEAELSGSPRALKVPAGAQPFYWVIQKFFTFFS